MMGGVASQTIAAAAGRGTTENVGVKSGSRAINDCWKHLSTKSDQHLANETTCMKCGTLVRHHRKSEKVKAHLNRCRPFLNSLRGATGVFGQDDAKNIPHWVVTMKNKMGEQQRIDTPATKKSRFALASPDTTLTAGGASTLNTSTGAATLTTTTTTVSSKKPRANRTMRDFLIPPLPAADRAAFQEEMAMYFYMCAATPFSRMEEPHLLRALQRLRPDIKLPSRKELSGRLLRSAHKKVKSKVETWLKRDHFACLVSDGWSNIKNESVTNYMLVSGDVSFFLELTLSGELSHTAEYLAGDLDRVISQTRGKVAGVVMDNTSANKLAWKLLKEKHPSKFSQGCVAHGLHLLVKDVFAATKTKPNNRPVADYPEGYPFEPLLIFVADCKKIVKYFHNHHGPKAMLKEAMHAAEVRELVQMAATQWGSLIGMVRSLLAAEGVLYQKNRSSLSYCRGV